MLPALVGPIPRGFLLRYCLRNEEGNVCVCVCVCTHTHTPKRKKNKRSQCHSYILGQVPPSQLVVFAKSLKQNTGRNEEFERKAAGRKSGPFCPASLERKGEKAKR